MGKLALVRHHESEWNKLGKWTGVVDVHLSEDGYIGAKEMGKLISDLTFDQAFTSIQTRAKETLTKMLEYSGREIKTEEAKEINERDYGDYTGKNKWEMKEILGEEEFLKLRRGWDYNVPNGESLKMVYERAVPFFLNHILPLLNNNKNVLVVAHGNSCRAIIKYIENISDSGISDVEMPFGSVLIYDLDKEGHIVKKETRSLEN